MDKRSDKRKIEVWVRDWYERKKRQEHGGDRAGDQNTHLHHHKARDVAVGQGSRLSSVHFLRRLPVLPLLLHVRRVRVPSA